MSNKKVVISVSEIKQLVNRLAEINRHNITDIEFVDDDGMPIEIKPSVIEEWRFTGLNVSNFIASGFYLDEDDED